MNGVVHVGGHKFEEAEKYIAEGRSPIIFFEPQELGNPPPGVYWAPFALGDCKAVIPFAIPLHLDGTRDTQSASALSLNESRAREIGWTPTKWEESFFEIITFDEWARGLGFEFGWRFNPCSLLVIDVQGMEMRVLKGFKQFLDGFTEAVIECSSPPLYTYGDDATKVCYFMERMGFIQISPILPHGDIYFVREKFVG